MHLADFTKMMAVDGQGHHFRKICQMKQARTAEERPEQQSPKLKPLFADETQADAGTKEGNNMLHVNPRF